MQCEELPVSTSVASPFGHAHSPSDILMSSMKSRWMMVPPLLNPHLHPHAVMSWGVEPSVTLFILLTNHFHHSFHQRPSYSDESKRMHEDRNYDFMTFINEYQRYEIIISIQSD